MIPKVLVGRLVAKRMMVLAFMVLWGEAKVVVGERVNKIMVTKRVTGAAFIVILLEFNCHNKKYGLHRTSI